MMGAFAQLALALLAGTALATPVGTQRPGHHKRWGTCWGSNPQGCPFGDVGSHGAVVTEVGTCSAIGVEIMKQGGNAADAIIASALCVGVIGGFHSGLGGGGFMVIRYNKDDGTHGYEQIDFRETMPAAGNETMYTQYGTNQTKSTVGGLAVGVPGELRAWKLLHDRHGSLPWVKLFEPTISVARNGYPVNYDLAGFLAGRDWILDNEHWSKVFAPQGTLLKEGDTVYWHSIANTLERIAHDGPDIFYQNSDIADNIISAIQSTGGIMTHEDLASYQPIVREAASISYRGKRIYSTTAPSSGAIVLSTLKIFEGLQHAEQSHQAIQALVEANKFGYGQRATLGDPAFTTNVSSLEASYLTETVAGAARALISGNSTHPGTYYNPSNYAPASREGGTSHLAAVDSGGMAISLTTTINLIWGSRVMTADGIILNNEMDDFSSPGSVNAFGFAANPINFIQPGKRPQSSIASSLVEDENGRLVMATGSAGGSRIITATLQELYNHIDLGLNASECTSHARWHDQLSGITYFDWPDPDRPIPLAGYSNETVDFFKDLGYNVSYQSPYSTSTSHVIARLPSGEWLAATDPRKPAGRGQAY
ncbi:gamma-glutamyltranspeptidase [Cutaneotrichosporon oleaginosum]|uniref:Glutathione hydrolase n=1 Tax=Cutaneotrichosporon oleaginosum TaxID=879819 RepID=A0A0J0XWH2_9TREE|nr:gamma-glutamyltranspeptidase [Cutaneotrichosporon oleaginosum]KLT45407.1 gamma-glutamyltranspeptidase [Cutaneotrichosporon oleaginosum]TXT14629.1 hypothetical protein COLE_00822 [Cutaneotrichosporon oleaginosum]